MYDLKGNLNIVVVRKSAAVTATGNGTGLDLMGYEGKVAIVFNVAAATAGTNPTYDAKVQDSPDNSTFTDIAGATITQVTTTDSIQVLSVDVRAQARYIRIVETIGGTSSPSFPAGAVLVSEKQYK